MKPPNFVGHGPVRVINRIDSAGTALIHDYPRRFVVIHAGLGPFDALQQRASVPNDDVTAYFA